jgi:hypothetical protein
MAMKRSLLSLLTAAIVFALASSLTLADTVKGGRCDNDAFNVFVNQLFSLLKNDFYVPNCEHLLGDDLQSFLGGGTVKGGRLGKGESDSYTIMCLAGNTYAFIASGGCASGVRIELYDETGKLMMRGDVRDRASAAMLTARYTEKVLVKIIMGETTVDKATWISTYGYK